MIANPDFFAGNAQEIVPDIQEIQTPEGELHLRFYLPSQEEFALSATGVKEVLQQAPEQITPIPNASPLLLGTMNLRGQVIWVADLGQFLGSPTSLNTDRMEIPVIAIEDHEIILGLAVERLGSMEWLDPEALQPSAEVPDRLLSYVRGEWTFKADTQDSPHLLRLLDYEAILRSARWAA